MKQRLIIALVCLFLYGTAQALSPDSCSVHHNDSCWYVTMNYQIDKLPTNDELIVQSLVCCPDTCIGDSIRRFQGRRYARLFKKRNGYTPELTPHGHHRCVIAIPENSVSDSIIGLTYSEYTSPLGTEGSIDSIRIFMPECKPMNIRPIKAALTNGDIMAEQYPYICTMSEYKVLNMDSNIHIPRQQINHVHYPMNSARLERTYMNNGTALDSISHIINSILADDRTKIESIQIVGFTAPDHSDEIVPKLGYKRACSMRDCIMQECNLPDSIFEVVDGGKNWQQVYTDLAALELEGTDSLLTLLYSKPTSKSRLATLRQFNGGNHYKAISSDNSGLQRGSCCTRIYYVNAPDSITDTLNEIVQELIINPHPDYHRLSDELEAYNEDPRALNIQGVIDYRRHRRHAAEKAFIEAAMQGDEQAALNLEILESENR